MMDFFPLSLPFGFLLMPVFYSTGFTHRFLQIIYFPFPVVRYLDMEKQMVSQPGPCFLQLASVRLAFSLLHWMLWPPFFPCRCSLHSMSTYYIRVFPSKHFLSSVHVFFYIFYLHMYLSLGHQCSSIYSHGAKMKMIAMFIIINQLIFLLMSFFFHSIFLLTQIPCFMFLFSTKAVVL